MLCLQHSSVFTIGKRGGVNDFRQGVEKVRFPLLLIGRMACCMCARICRGDVVCAHICRLELRSIRFPGVAK